MLIKFHVLSSVSVGGLDDAIEGSQIVLEVIIDSVDTIAVVFFTFEYVIRLIICPRYLTSESARSHNLRSVLVFRSSKLVLERIFSIYIQLSKRSCNDILNNISHKYIPVRLCFWEDSSELEIIYTSHEQMNLFL